MRPAVDERFVGEESALWGGALRQRGNAGGSRLVRATGRPFGRRETSSAGCPKPA